MATPRSQRIGIWIIAIFMLLGALGTSLVMMMSMDSQSSDDAEYQKAITDYQKKFTEREAKVASQAKKLSDKYYSEFKQYESIPASFKTADIKKVTHKDLKVGSGKEIKSDTKYNAYYIGWNSKGVIFDQSIEKGSLKAPIAGEGLITGWQEGVIGMKFGGVRELSIPSDKAYGSKGQGDDIPPNMPIKFIVMIIPPIEEIPEVPIPDIILQRYNQ